MPTEISRTQVPTKVLGTFHDKLKSLGTASSSERVSCFQGLACPHRFLVTLAYFHEDKTWGYTGISWKYHENVMKYSDLLGYTICV